MEAVVERVKLMAARARLPSIVGLALLGGAGASVSATAAPAAAPPRAPAHTAVALPAQLQLLEQRMSQLHVDSERWAESLTEPGTALFESSSASGRRAPVHRRNRRHISIHRRLLGEATVSPAASEQFLAGRPLLLSSGSTFYLYAPEPSRAARGRPWLRSSG